MAIHLSKARSYGSKYHYDSNKFCPNRSNPSRSYHPILNSTYNRQDIRLLGMYNRLSQLESPIRRITRINPPHHAIHDNGIMQNLAGAIYPSLNGPT
jgi:hypothetical protein